MPQPKLDVKFWGVGISAQGVIAIIAAVLIALAFIFASRV